MVVSYLVHYTLNYCMIIFSSHNQLLCLILIQMLLIRWHNFEGKGVKMLGKGTD